MNEYIKRLTAVINTLNATVIRADQIAAIKNISVCTMELQDMIHEMKNAKTEEPKKEDEK